VAPLQVPDLGFRGRPAGGDAALVPGGRAEPDGGGAHAPVLVRFVRADPLNRPGHADLAVGRNKPVQHGRRPRIGRQLSTRAARAAGAEDQPAPQAAQHHQAGRGTASLAAVAMVIASGIGCPAARAASSHAAS
jgi:hypothetical protein